MRQNGLTRFLKGFDRRRSLGATLILIVLAIIGRVLNDGGLTAHAPDGPDGGSGSLQVEGRARLVDGDSLFIGRREVRMVGVDAPEGPQICQRAGRDWRCGDAARQALATLIGGRSIRCQGNENDQHGRLLGTCYVGSVNLNREIVAGGHAVAYGRYRAEERAAKAAGRGLWGRDVTFQMPRQWRRANRVGG